MAPPSVNQSESKLLAEVGMKKSFKLLSLALVVTAILVVALASAAFAAGPNPTPGDCIPDGTGLFGHVGPLGDVPTNQPVGPAPNSGDGISDGSGF
jgi:hypothetical protein